MYISINYESIHNAFCSIFPSGYPINMWLLIFLWMAHDLLPQSKNGKTSKKVGEKYFRGLSSRSFLQRSPINDLDF